MNKEIHQYKNQDLYNEVKKFADRIMALKLSINLTMTYIDKLHDDSCDELDKYIKENTIEKNGINYIIGVDKYYKFRYLVRTHRVLNQSIDIVPCGYFIALICQYDAFVGRILKYLLMNNPKIISNEEKILSFSEVMSFDKVDSIIDYILDHEVEKFLRKSHVEQFEYLENKFGVQLRKDLDSWRSFVEITERRNLFAHCDGYVSKRYITNCIAYCGSVDNDCQLNTRLEISPQYINTAIDVVTEIAIKLSQVLWRKILKNNDGEADQNLSEIMFDGLCLENYSMIKSLYSFCNKYIKDYSDDETRLVILINCAIAYKFSGDTDEYKTILSTVDWSSRSDKFKMARAILLDKFDSAIKYMRRIGSDGEVSKEAYLNWPLFKDIKETQEFKDAFEEIFKEQYTEAYSMTNQSVPLAFSGNVGKISFKGRKKK